MYLDDFVEKLKMDGYVEEYDYQTDHYVYYQVMGKPGDVVYLASDTKCNRRRPDGFTVDAVVDFRTNKIYTDAGYLYHNLLRQNNRIIIAEHFQSKILKEFRTRMNEYLKQTYVEADLEDLGAGTVEDLQAMVDEVEKHGYQSLRKCIDTWMDEDVIFTLQDYLYLSLADSLLLTYEYLGDSNYVENHFGELPLERMKLYNIIRQLYKGTKKPGLEDLKEKIWTGRENYILYKKYRKELREKNQEMEVHAPAAQSLEREQKKLMTMREARIKQAAIRAEQEAYWRDL